MVHVPIQIPPTLCFSQEQFERLVAANPDEAILPGFVLHLQTLF